MLNTCVQADADNLGRLNIRERSAQRESSSAVRIAEARSAEQFVDFKTL